MSIVLKNVAPLEEWVEFKAGGESMELLLRRPTYQDLIDDLRGTNSGLRILRAVKDWKGVVDQDGNAVPFSAEACMTLFESFPVVFADVASRVCDMYLGNSGEREKN